MNGNLIDLPSSHRFSIFDKSANGAGQLGHLLERLQWMARSGQVRRICGTCDRTVQQSGLLAASSAVIRAGRAVISSGNNNELGRKGGRARYGRIISIRWEREQVNSWQALA